MTRLSAEEIAESQLLSALRIWREEEYIAAITLAGAAEEVLGRRLRKLGREPSFDNLKKAIVAMSKKLGDDNPDTEKVVGELLNSTRNELKHYSGDEALEFDLKEDASELLERAIYNYRILTGNIHSEMIDFFSSAEDA